MSSQQRRKFWDFINILIIVICVGVLILLGAGIKRYLDYSQLKEQMVSLTDDIHGLILENNLLEQKVEQHKDDFYLEAEARSKFNLKKPGETVVVIKNISNLKELDSVETTLSKKIAEKQKSNLMLWWQYFFADS